MKLFEVPDETVQPIEVNPEVPTQVKSEGNMSHTSFEKEREISARQFLI